MSRQSSALLARPDQQPSGLQTGPAIAAPASVGAEVANGQCRYRAQTAAFGHMASESGTQYVGEPRPTVRAASPLGGASARISPSASTATLLTTANTLLPTLGAVWQPVDHAPAVLGNAANGSAQLQCRATTPSVPPHTNIPVPSVGTVQLHPDRLRSQSPVQCRGRLDTQAPLPHGRAHSPTFSFPSGCGAVPAQPRNPRSSVGSPLATIVHGPVGIPSVQLSGSTNATAAPSAQPCAAPGTALASAPAQLRSTPSAYPLLAQSDPRGHHGANGIQHHGVLSEDLHARPLKVVDNMAEKNGVGKSSFGPAVVPPPPPPNPPVKVPYSAAPQEARIGAYFPDADTFTI